MEIFEQIRMDYSQSPFSKAMKYFRPLDDSILRSSLNCEAGLHQNTAASVRLHATAIPGSYFVRESLLEALV